MTPRVDIRCGDALTELRGLPSESVNCCVTSPPYWGLRDYKTGKWEGGDLRCEHVKSEMRRGMNLAQSVCSIRGGAKKVAEVEDVQYGNICGKCGARRIDYQIGLESTLEEYVSRLVAVFREVRRVLRHDGTLWLNLGDSYTASYCGGDTGNSGLQGSTESQDQSKLAGQRAGHRSSFRRDRMPRQDVPHKKALVLKSKNLIGVPWRVAFALQEDGWYLRSDIIWSKPNPMPESIKDRPTKAHEYLFLLAKSERYYYDAEEIAEPVSASMLSQIKQGYEGMATKDFHAAGVQDASSVKSRILGKHRKPAGWNTGLGGHGSIHRNGRAQQVEYSDVTSLKRNRRTVWTVPTAPYAGAHFATFPPDLIKPCILAGCPAGGVVLDPFLGSGTTGMVSLELGRSCIGIELNPKYCELARQRCAVTPGLQLT